MISVSCFQVVLERWGKGFSKIYSVEAPLFFFYYKCNFATLISISAKHLKSSISQNKIVYKKIKRLKGDQIFGPVFKPGGSTWKKMNNLSQNHRRWPFYIHMHTNYQNNLLQDCYFLKKKKKILGGDHDKFVRTLPNIDLHQT